MTTNHKVSRDFANSPDPALDEFANTVATKLQENSAFPAPPVTPANLLALDTAFRDAIAAAASGGPQETAAKNNARGALVDALRKDANYVEINASHDLETLLSSGYVAASTNHAQSPLDAPVITAIENLASTQLLLHVKRVTNARSYHVQFSTNGNGAWQEAGIFTQARRIVLTGLTPGTVYNMRVRAIGGSTGQSDWSIPAPHMAT